MAVMSRGRSRPAAVEGQSPLPLQYTEVKLALPQGNWITTLSGFAAGQFLNHTDVIADSPNR
jgi:hypothetical protein